MSVRLYESMYESDIIVSSPLSIRKATGLQKTEDEATPIDTKENFDFLSSLEFVVVDQAEAFYFQNPEHLEEVLKVLNKRPKKLSGLGDINRLRSVYTEDSLCYLPKLFRQNIIIQKFNNTELNFIFD